MAGNTWVIEVNQKLHMVNIETETHNWDKRSIYRVPAYATDLNERAYRPQVVSFGPYHHGEEPLLQMEEHKETALLHFLKRRKIPLQSLVDSFTEVVQDLQDSYNKLDESWKTDTGKFIKLMILDGCFMLEILRASQLSENDYAANDPVFSKHGQQYLMPFISHDMLMLENQLPMLVLYKLVEVEGIPKEECHRLITLFWFPDVRDEFDNFLHVLDGYRRCLLNLHVEKNTLKTEFNRDSGNIIGSATQLDEAGINFQKSKTTLLTDIYFQSGVLELPVIEVDDAFESIFLNLIAFERFHFRVGNEISSYVLFMSKIIGNEEDVALLHSKGIIQSALGSDKAVVKLFNSLSKSIALELDSRLDTLCAEVKFYCMISLIEMENADEADEWDKCSIYRVPVCATDLNERAYRPRTVSFGPYHYGKEALLPMEKHKKRACLHFLKEKSLQSLENSFTAIVHDLQDSYDKLDKSWKSDTKEFIMMMIVDGCFMLEILRFSTQLSENDYAINDPVFSKNGQQYLMPFIRRDMLMLENQLPVVVLYKLVEFEGTNNKEEYVNRLITEFFFPDMQYHTGFDNFLHILDGYRKCLLNLQGEKNITVESVSSRDSYYFIKSATELDEAGIKFEANKTTCLRGISFDSGVLKLPGILVNDSFESIFLNLIAFERLRTGVGNEIRSYILFMSNIIDSERDVALLHSSGIIQSTLGGNDNVVKVFNSLSKDIDLDPNSGLDAVHRSVIKYCKQPLNKWRGNFMHNMHTYFRQPWSVLSLFAALTFFAFTFAQTIYTIYPYYNPQ